MVHWGNTAGTICCQSLPDIQTSYFVHCPIKTREEQGLVRTLSSSRSKEKPDLWNPLLKSRNADFNLRILTFSNLCWQARSWGSRYPWKPETAQTLPRYWLPPLLTYHHGVVPKCWLVETACCPRERAQALKAVCQVYALYTWLIFAQIKKS